MLSQSAEHPGSSRLSVGSRQGLNHLPDRMFPLVRYLVALFALTLVMGLSGRVACDEVKPKSPAQQQFEKGIAQLGEKNYAQAEASFTKALEINPKFAPAYLGLADIRQLQGDVSGAGEFLRKAVAIAPGNAPVQTAWGQYLYSQKQFVEAEKAFQKAIQADPKAAVPHVQLGDLYLLALNRPGDAVAAYRASLALNPSDVRANFMFGTALLAVGKTGEGEAQLVKAQDMAPTDMVIRKAVADLQLRQGELDAAMANFHKTLEIAPNATWAQIGIGDVFRQQKAYDRAISAYRDALNQNPNSVEAQTKLGMAQEFRGDLQAAEASYRKALAMDPKNGVAANNLAWMLGVKDQRPKDALPWAQKAVAANPKNANFLDTQGWIMRANGDAAGAAVVLKKAVILAPHDPGILYHLGVVYQELGNRSLAAESYGKALAMDKQFNDVGDAQARLAAIKPQK
jgi:Tfp pilus assembly protein PilF